MNCVTIDLNALHQNLRTISGWLEGHGASWTVVTKALCGHPQTLRALRLLGVRSMADSRIENLAVGTEVARDVERWYLRLPQLSAVDDVVRLADVSLNTESEVIRALSDAAGRLDRVHRVVIMVELGDLREGILPGTLVNFYRKILDLPNVEVLGIGAQLGCLAGAVPTIDQFAQLALYHELLELKFERRLPIISAGSTVSLSLLLEGRLPRKINHFRIGEALFLGTDLVHGGVLQGLRDDVVFLEAEIADITEKSLVPLGETGAHTPFAPVAQPKAPNGDDAAHHHGPGERGYRALVTVGQLDTDVAGLTPVDPHHAVAGGSSDITVVNLGRNPGGLKVGDTLRFRLDYAAFVRLMSSRYVERRVVPDLETFGVSLAPDQPTRVPPVLERGGRSRP